MLWLAGIVAVMGAPQTAGRAELTPEILLAVGSKDWPAAVAALDRAAAACAAMKRSDDHCLDLYLGGANIAWRVPDAAASEKFARVAVEIASRALPPTHRDRGIAYRYLMRTLMAQRKFREAEPVLLQSIQLAEAVGDPGLAALYQRYSDALYGQGKTQAADAAVRTALKLFDSGGGDANSRIHAIALRDVAALERDDNRPAQAVELAQRAIAMIEQAAPGDDELSSFYRILGLSFNDLGRYADAETALRKAIGFAEADPRASVMARTTLYTSLAFAVDKQNRLDEGEALVRKAIAQQEAGLPPSSPQIAENYSNLAWNLDAQGKYVEAEAAARKSVQLRETYLKPGDPGIATGYQTLGGVLSNQDRHSETETLYRRVLTLREAERPQNPDNLAFAYSNLASVLDEQYRFTESEPLLRKALTIAEMHFPPGHPELAVIYANLAHNISSQQRFAEAEPFHRKALAVWQSGLPATHPAIAGAMRTLGANLESQNRTAEAEQLFRQARAITESLRPSHPDRINGSWTLAALFKKHRMRPAEARTLYRSAEAGAVERIRSFTAFDATAQGELRKYAPIFAGQISVAWQLSQPAAKP